MGSMLATPYIGWISQAFCESGGFGRPLADIMLRGGHAGADVGSRARVQAEHICKDGELNLQKCRPQTPSPLSLHLRQRIPAEHLSSLTLSASPIQHPTPWPLFSNSEADTQPSPPSPSLSHFCARVFDSRICFWIEFSRSMYTFYNAIVPCAISTLDKPCVLPIIIFV
ncbi:hypothetical protein BJX96DRAFT_33957 [Aspergillus floccosus]